MINNHLFYEDKLILFIDLNYEFACFDNDEKTTFKDSILNYIKNNNIIYKGKILLVFGGILLATFNYKNDDLTLKKINKTNDIIYTSSFENINKTPYLYKNIVDNKEVANEKKTVVNNEKVLDSKVTSNKKTASTNKATENKSSNDNNVNNNSTVDEIQIPTKKTETNNNFSISNSVSSNNTKVTIYRSTGKVLTLDLEEYLIGVVASEMPASFNIEALKAQVVLARTYALKAIKNNKKLTDTVSTQTYIDNNEMKTKWGNVYDKYYNKIKDAVTKTKGIYVTYNGELIDAVYHSTSNGKTEDAINVWGYSIPYLKSVESEYDKNVSSYFRTITKTENDILKSFGIDELTNLEIISRNSSGRVEKIKVSDNIYSGFDFRNLLSLRSADFDIEKDNDNYIITTRGYGHGVGMSQYGSNEMAKDGYTYEQIIKHYYTGVKINK